jgi:hypothetical protein
MNQVFVISVTVNDDGDHKSRQYGVNDVSELDAKGTLERYLKDSGIEHSQEMKIRLASPGQAMSLKLSGGSVRLLN